MKKTVTLRDLAKATGVHVSTVSRALDPTNRSALSEDVVKRIRELAKEMGYRPNRLAAGLRTNRSMTVGIIIPDITNSLFPPLLRGIESVLEPSGYATIIVNTDNLADREIRLMDVLRERGVDGIIHAAVLSDDPKVSEVANQGMPVVTVNRKIGQSNIPSVVSDDAHGIHLSLQHLYEQGHRKIAHIAGPKDLSTGQIRLAAFRMAQSKLGLKSVDCPVSFANKFDESEGRNCAKSIHAARRI